MRRFIPFISTLRIYKRSWLSNDLVAGLTIGIMLIPQGMAYAMLANLPPIYGLYASTVPLIIYAFLGTSRQLAVGPVAIVSLLVAGGISSVVSPNAVEYVALAILLAFMVGMIQLLMGLLKAGNIIKLIPHSVISGFTTGAALIIMASQLKSLLGMAIPRGNFVDTISYTVSNISEVNLPSFLIGLTSIVVLFVSKRLNPKIPTPLIIITILIILISIFELNNFGVQIIGDIPGGFPSLMPPMIEMEYMIVLLPIAITISIIGYMESIAVAKVVQKKHRDYKLDNNQELVGLGMANIIGSFFQSYPTTGGFSRTAVNDEAGAKTGLASIISAILIILTLQFLTKYFYHLPLTALAAIIIVAVFGLVDIKEAKRLLNKDKQGFLLFITTALLTLAFGVEVGLGMGIFLAILLVVLKKIIKPLSVTKVTHQIKSMSEIRSINYLKTNKMKIEQIYTGCLAQGAYFIHSNGEAAIIDPLREVTPYLQKAEKEGVKIKYILETHFHADFVSGHLTLAEKTGAPIIYGPNANPKFDAHIAKDGDLFELGDISIKVLHTPGHTMESTTYLLIDENGKEIAIFTGDTLFLGDVGRPDLAQKSSNITTEDLASYAYDSLRNKIMVLPDDVLVYPAHGAGSACGKNMMKETVDTLGNQKRINYALRADMTKEEFIKEVTSGLDKPPAYFPLNVKMNREGYDDVDRIIKNGIRPLSPDVFELNAETHNALILDARSKDDFAKAHIPNSIFIGLDGSFAPWVGELIVDVLQPILLVVDEGREKEAVTRLARVGFDNTLGVLEGGISAWTLAGKETDSVNQVVADAIRLNHNEGRKKVFDVRKSSEYISEHVLNAFNVPLSELNDHLSTFPKQEDFFIHCASGYRSMIAASILKSRGFHNVIDISGGIKAIKQTDALVTDYVCPTTLNNIN